MITSLKFYWLPKDEADEGAAFLEIRAGAGGEEAAIFAADIYRMYTRFCERQKWKVEESIFVLLSREALKR